MGRVFYNRTRQWAEKIGKWQAPLKISKILAPSFRWYLEKPNLMNEILLAINEFRILP